MTISKLKCFVFRQIRSGYVDIAKHCDTAAVFHAFGAYLLRVSKISYKGGP